MELFFADDSGKDATKDTYLIEAAVAFDEAQLSALDAYIRTLRKKYGIPSRYELHWATRTYKHQERRKSVVGCALSPQRHHQLRLDFLAFLAQANVKVIAAAVRHTKSRTLMSSMTDAIELIAERAQMHLQTLYHVRKQNVLGLLIVDQPGSDKENRQLMQSLYSLQTTGTRYISKFNNLASALVYPSHLLSGIQLADFVAGAFDAFLNRQDDSWWSVLEPHMRRKKPNGAILGYGLIIRPQVSPVAVGSVTVV